MWLRATRRGDDAILIVKVGRFPPGATVHLMRDLDATERAIGTSRREAAPMLFTEQILADRDMPRLFAAATHYWSMSHGEGWDQPMIEAGATGLRLIAPMHSAYTAYLDGSIARMIPARLVSVDASGDGDMRPLCRRRARRGGRTGSHGLDGARADRGQSHVDARDREALRDPREASSAARSAVPRGRRVSVALTRGGDRVSTTPG
ncbi:MAG: hypothetical protein DMD81_18340 [Candidatus Rokuibacteriota bacterium]|nr:MAG: hypothetical protein DMD81_18340 [Candidatus Rokubacteria bacterium]